MHRACVPCCMRNNVCKQVLQGDTSISYPPTPSLNKAHFGLYSPAGRMCTPWRCARGST